MAGHAGEPSCPIFLFFGDFYKYDVRPSIIRYMLPSYHKHNAPQSTRTSNKASTCRSGRDNASQKTELAPADMSSSIYTARCADRAKKSKFVRPTKVTNHSQRSLTGVMRDGFLPVQRSFSPFFLFRPYMRRAGVLGTIPLLTFARRQFAPKTMDTCVRCSHSHLSILLCEQMQQAAEAACGAERLVTTIIYLVPGTCYLACYSSCIGHMSHPLHPAYMLNLRL